MWVSRLWLELKFQWLRLPLGVQVAVSLLAVAVATVAYGAAAAGVEAP